MAVRLPQYIFGIHDPGDWMDRVQAAGKQGWVLVSEEIGSDPQNPSGRDYTWLSNRGFGVIVRLHHGYAMDGTIPSPEHYADFAQRCANWVSHSAGAQVWIIGSEMNLASERPGGPSDENQITPELYWLPLSSARFLEPSPPYAATR